MYCGKEHDIDLKQIDDRGWSGSHGFCRRHFLEYMKANNVPEDEQKSELEEFNQQPPCRDLSDKENKPLLDWLKNPTIHKDLDTKA